jgi:hypothetical protein
MRDPGVFRSQIGEELAGLDSSEIIAVPIDPAVGELRAETVGFAEDTREIQLDFEVEILEETAQSFDAGATDIEPVVIGRPTGVAFVAEIGLSLDDVRRS